VVGHACCVAGRRVVCGKERALALAKTTPNERPRERASERTSASCARSPLSLSSHLAPSFFFLPVLSPLAYTPKKAEDRPCLPQSRCAPGPWRATGHQGWGGRERVPCAEGGETQFFFFFFFFFGRVAGIGDRRRNETPSPPTPCPNSAHPTRAPGGRGDVVSPHPRGRVPARDAPRRAPGRSKSRGRRPMLSLSSLSI
jgi:hypothetical protein